MKEDNFDFSKELNKIVEYKKDGFEWELSTGYTIWVDKFDKKEKSYRIMIAENGSNHFIQVGRLTNPKAFKKAFNKINNESEK